MKYKMNHNAKHRGFNKIKTNNTLYTIDWLGFPESLSATVEITGILSTGPTTGRLLRKARTSGKKDPKRFTKPKSSTSIPTTG